MVARTERGTVADWMRTVDPWLLGAFVGLMAIGVVMALAASPAVAEHIGLPDSISSIGRRRCSCLRRRCWRRPRCFRRGTRGAPRCCSMPARSRSSSWR